MSVTRHANSHTYAYRIESVPYVARFLTTGQPRGENNLNVVHYVPTQSARAQAYILVLTSNPRNTSQVDTTLSLPGDCCCSPAVRSNASDSTLAS